MTEHATSEGLLVVSNLYMGSNRPALRFDEDFYEVVKSKLRKVFSIALEQDLTIVFTGVFTQKLWDTSLFSYLVGEFQKFEGKKPVIVLDEPILLRNGEVRPNSIAELLKVVGVVDLVDQHNTHEVFVRDTAFGITMAARGTLMIKKMLDKPITIINSDDSLPSLVRTRLDEKEAASAILKLTLDSVEEIVIDSGIAPIDDVSFDLAEEIKTFDSELVGRLQALMSQDRQEDDVKGDTDLRALCDEMGVPGEAREIVFGLKDEVVAEDL